MSTQEKATPTFIGRFNCTLDEKGRLMIPAKFRRLFPNEEIKSLIISKAKDKCLRLFAPERFEAIIEKLGALEDGDLKRNLIRFYSTESEQIKVDGSGRIAIPAEYIATIDNAKDLVVVGALTHMEVWKQTDYEKVRQDAIDTYRKSTWEL
jgi:MraZ protein